MYKLCILFLVVIFAVMAIAKECIPSNQQCSTISPPCCSGNCVLQGKHFSICA
uniref:Teratocyte protein CftICK-I n=1 Tax=Cotesia flavipes TaxID=89805 RepID=TP1_COTFL|nr:RecName: Full=Teratocyte protein CftICK-I; Flags: Precursor [Cotesia flavipes]UEP64313.1 teratocyte protein II [Cotesia flavipes]